MAELGDFSGRGAFAEHLLDRVTRNDVDHQENQSEDEPERRKCKKESRQQVARHQRESAEGLDCDDFAARTDCGSSVAGGETSPGRSAAGGRAR